MANTTTMNGSFIHVLFDGATGWDIARDFRDRPEWHTIGMKVASVSIIPSANNDAIVIRNTLNANKTSAKVLQELALSEYDIIRRHFYSDGQYMFPAVHEDEVSSGVQMIMEIAG